MDYRQLTHRLLSFEKFLIDTSLCLLLLTMIVLASLQICLRTWFSGGLLWIEPLLRYLVLWCGMLGAVVATREKKHIAIDVVGYLAPESLKPWIGLLIDFFSSLVSGVLTWAAIIFVQNEHLFGGSALLGLPTWIWYLIFPIAFALITLHFLLAIGREIGIIGSHIQHPEPERAK